MIDFESLNREQREAVLTTQGPLLILAGAGSGKTRVLTYRIAHLIEDEGVYPASILAITFTNKAAGEMKERVERLVGEAARDMWIATFHSVCVRILRRDIDKIGYNKNFVIFDSSDQQTLMKHCLKELNVDDKIYTPKGVLEAISKAKNELITPGRYIDGREYDFRAKKISEIYALYQKKLLQNNALDFDDIIVKTIELFDMDKAVLDYYQRRFKYIHVDEYQDTNYAQYKLISLLAENHRNLCVVGDDDQCVAEGTMIKGVNGDIPVQHIKEQDLIACAAGSGEITRGSVEKICKKKYHGPMIRILTEGGKVLKATPNHLTFAKINIIRGIHYVYLMYKRDMGYRIGQTQAVRSRKSGNMSNGLAVRLNQEQADKAWILKICSTKGEASFYEQYYSTKYGIPTVVFSEKGRAISMNQELLNKLYREINTYEAADRIMADHNLYIDYPHHFSSAVVRGNTARRIVNISFFSCKKSARADYYSHRISFITSGEESREKFKREGFFTRKEKNSSWRVETERREYDEAEAFAKRLSAVDSLDIIRKAKLTDDSSFYFLPVGSLREGMSIGVYANGRVVEDKVAKITVEEYDGYVYDLSIPELRQYISDDVIVHNSIYGWRGADIRNILEFEKEYPNTKVIKLEQNYRSTQVILDGANGVISNNRGRKAKRLWTEKKSGDKITVFETSNEQEEAHFIATTILKGTDEGASFNDYAVLYRTNAQSRAIEEALMRYRIPYRVVGGQKFYDRKEIKDIIAYLRVIINPSDNISLGRIINVPRRNIGDTTYEKLQRYASLEGISVMQAVFEADKVEGLSTRAVSSVKKFGELMERYLDSYGSFSVSGLIKDVLENTGYIKELEKSGEIEDETRIENLQEFLSAAEEFEKTAEDNSLLSFLEGVALVSDLDNVKEEEHAVIIMTLHSAKGLEFPVVFMAGMEQGIFPHIQSMGNEDEIEEERRLCYVGMTRAKKKLYMSYAYQRTLFGRTQCNAVSDFLNEIPPQVIEGMEEKIQRREEKRSLIADKIVNRMPVMTQREIKVMASKDSIRVGQKVSHKNGAPDLSLL